MSDYLKTNRRKLDGEALRQDGKRWIERIEAAAKLEKDWIDDAEKAETAYTGKHVSGDHKDYDFNILFSNVETIVPAIINSPPQPDIRRRFADNDPVAKDGSEVLERAIRIQVDDSKLQIEMESAAQDAFLAGRGIVRLRFKADVEGGETDNDDLKELAEDFAEGEDDDSPAPTDPEDSDASDSEQSYTDGSVSADDTGAENAQGMGRNAQLSATVRNERICFEAVSWRDYRHGPAKRWEDRPWEAFRHSMPMEDVEAFADTALSTAQLVPEDKIAEGNTDNDVVVWEVWNRKDRSVRFIEQDTGKVLKIVDDPLGLSNFYPICTPIQPIAITGRLMPVNPFSIYRKLADELDTTTRRINAITKQMKVAGWYSGDATELSNMLDSLDTDFVPISNPEMWAQNGGLAGAVAFWPIEKFIIALRELYNNREATKQAIYEITGISDIVRGASAAAETATAQNIKSQWGSLRIQKMQRMVERAARDLFVMMSEIIASKFSDETLQTMTGVQLLPTEQEMQPIPPPPMPPQPQQGADPQQLQQMQQQFQQAMGQYKQAEQARQQKLQHLEGVRKILSDTASRFYRIDVESDSTVRADLTQKKQEQAEFLQGTAAYFKGVEPMVASGVMSREGALKIYAATARLFTLGKSTEDALDTEVARAEEEAKQPKQEGPNPELLKLQLEEQKAKSADAQAQAKMQADERAASQKAQIEAMKAEQAGRKAEADAALAQSKLEIEQQRIKLDEYKAQLAAATAIDVAEIKAGNDAEADALNATLESSLNVQNHTHEAEMQVRDQLHQQTMQAAEHQNRTQVEAMKPKTTDTAKPKKK
ncbi:cell envelope integrity protein TolA [Devosia algicola]|uniref:Cell envelope integrity protein TolA n=1 Tax=Devosia algicola TaxID=3026418 RepID=A0ABY7YQU6_9HYPH|nr:cell envelope integrity protein TolA [Devosia algicola]WDR03631.1 cell envelope integrity protein TolA [Devosia algicola]